MGKEGYMNKLYTGGYKSLSPDSGETYTGYRISAGQLGTHTTPGTNNQLMEVANMLNQGAVNIELMTIGGGDQGKSDFAGIPSSHITEMRRLAQLTGAKISVHAPVIEPSGFNRNGWDESQRMEVERELLQVANRAAKLDKAGKVPITIHASNMAGDTYYTDPETGERRKQMVVIDRSNPKQLTVLKDEVKYYPGSDLNKGKKFDLNTELNSLNGTQWDDSLNQVLYLKEKADEIIKNSEQVLAPILPLISTNDEEKREEVLKQLTPQHQKSLRDYKIAETYLSDVQRQLNGIFDKAYKYGGEETKEELKKISENYSKQIKEIQKSNAGSSASTHSNLIFGLVQELKNVSPEFFVPVETFQIENSSKTIGNVAFKSFEENKDQAPRIVVENPPAGFGLSFAEGQKKLIEASREHFKKEAMKKGYGEKFAEKKAEELIGANFDLGHINISKKMGFTDEDIKKEAQEIAKYVKHIHLTDNFGFYDSHLPPGMGNVPIKEIMEVIDKGPEIRKIVEAGEFSSHFKTSHLPFSFQGMGADMTSYSGGGYWNQYASTIGSYYSGLGEIFPQQNFQTFGVTFSRLPTELGGSTPGGTGGRMSGTPME